MALEKIREGGWRELRSQTIGAGISIVSPWISAAVVFVTGLVQLPVAYAITASGIMFAAVSFGAFYFYNLFFQRSPEAKFIPLYPTVKIIQPETDGVPKIEKIQVGMVFRNSATFPIEYQVTEMQHVVDGRVNPDASLALLHAVVYPNTEGGFSPDLIDIHDLIFPRTLDCRIKVVVKYGRPGDLRYELRKGYKITVPIVR